MPCAIERPRTQQVKSIPEGLDYFLEVEVFNVRKIEAI